MLLRFSLIIRTLKSSATRPNYRIAKPVGLSSSLAFHLLFNIFLVKKLANPMLSLVVPIIFRTTKITKTVFFSRPTSSPLRNASRFPLIILNSSNGSKTPNSLILKFPTSYDISSLPNPLLLVPRFVNTGRSKMDLSSVGVVSTSPRMTPSAVILSNYSTISPPLDTPVVTKPTISFAVTSSGPGWAALFSVTSMAAPSVNRQRINLIALLFPFSLLPQPKMPPRSLPHLWISLSLFPRLTVLMPLRFLLTMMSPKWPSSPPVIPISPRKELLIYIVTMSGNGSVFPLNLSRIVDPSSPLPSLAPSVTPSVSPRPCPPLIILRRTAKLSVLTKVWNNSSAPILRYANTTGLPISPLLNLHIIIANILPPTSLRSMPLWVITPVHSPLPFFHPTTPMSNLVSPLYPNSVPTSPLPKPLPINRGRNGSWRTPLPFTPLAIRCGLKARTSRTSPLP